MFGFRPFRDRHFVDRRIQGGLISRVALYWVLYHVVLWHVLLVCRYVQLRVTGSGGQSPAAFGDQFWQLGLDYAPILLCGLFTLPVVMIDMLYLSHRIAGPLIQFGSALRDLREGRRVDRVDLRRQDLLAGFQEEFNEYLGSLGQPSAVQSAGDGNPPHVSGGEAHIAARMPDRRSSIPVARDSLVRETVPPERATGAVASS
jgi:hypothetical protein